MQTEYHREGNCYGESFEVCCRFEVIEATDESHTFQESPVDEDSSPHSHSAKDIKTDSHCHYIHALLRYHMAGFTSPRLSTLR